MANRMFLQKLNQIKHHKGMSQHFSEKQWSLCSKQKAFYSNKLQHGATKVLLEMENVVYYQGCF